jgi:hypothetical protein
MVQSSSLKTWLPLLLVASVMLGPCLAEKKDKSLDWKWHKGRATYYGRALRRAALPSSEQHSTHSSSSLTEAQASLNCFANAWIDDFVCAHKHLKTWGSVWCQLGMMVLVATACYCCCQGQGCALKHEHVTTCFLPPFCLKGTDEWIIHKGSCGYGAIWSDEPHGWDVSGALLTYTQSATSLLHHHASTSTATNTKSCAKLK